MARLSASEKENAKGFLMDLFFVGGLINESHIGIGSLIENRLGDMDSYGPEVVTICEEIKLRVFNFFEVDQALEKLANCRFFGDPKIIGDRNHPTNSKLIKRAAPRLASYIADYCAALKIYWDDIYSNRSVQEIEEYKKTTIGAALWAEGCFASQVANGNKTTSNKSSGTTRTPGQPPANNYKQSGPRSKDARGLIGQPGEKIQLTGKVWSVYGVNTRSKSGGTSWANALINPLDAKGADPNNPSVNKVFINSSHGYTDCTIFVESQQEAQDLLAKCQAICPSYVTNLQVGAATAKPGGYFKVDTTFGPVYILAQKLNEAREKLDAKEASMASPKYAINNIEAFEEAFHKYE